MPYQREGMNTLCRPANHTMANRTRKMTSGIRHPNTFQRKPRRGEGPFWPDLRPLSMVQIAKTLPRSGGFGGDDVLQDIPAHLFSLLRLTTPPARSISSNAMNG